MLSKQGRTREDGCDVVVVGAGLVGAAVAARLAREGYKTAILEARRVAGGATGQSSGLVMTGLPGYYNWAISVYGRDQAREIWALTSGGRERLVEAAKPLHVPLERPGSLMVALDEEEATDLQESTEFLREDGFDAWFGRGDPLGRGFMATLRQPDDVTVDAAALTQALLTESDVIVHERTEVHKLEPVGDDVRIWAQRRMVRCGAVVLAVNGYAPLAHDYFVDKVTPTRGLARYTDPLADVVLEQPCSTDYGYVYGRQWPDKRIGLSICRRENTDPDVEPETALADCLTDLASEHFPEVAINCVEQSSEVIGFTPDGLPLLGTLPELPQVYFAVGFGGRGLAWAFVVAEQLVDAMLGRAELGMLSAERLAT